MSSRSQLSKPSMGNGHKAAKFIAPGKLAERGYEFDIPIDAEGHYLVAKFTPMTEDGDSGEPRYVISEKQVEEQRMPGESEPNHIFPLETRKKLPAFTHWGGANGECCRTVRFTPLQFSTPAFKQAWK